MSLQLASQQPMSMCSGLHDCGHYYKSKVFLIKLSGDECRIEFEDAEEFDSFHGRAMNMLGIGPPHSDTAAFVFGDRILRRASSDTQKSLSNLCIPDGARLSLILFQTQLAKCTQISNAIRCSTCSSALDGCNYFSIGGLLIDEHSHRLYVACRNKIGFIDTRNLQDVHYLHQCEQTGAFYHDLCLLGDKLITTEILSTTEVALVSIDIFTGFKMRLTPLEEFVNVNVSVARGGNDTSIYFLDAEGDEFGIYKLVPSSGGFLKHLVRKLPSHCFNLLVLDRCGEHFVVIMREARKIFRLLHVTSGTDDPEQLFTSSHMLLAHLDDDGNLYLEESARCDKDIDFQTGFNIRVIPDFVEKVQSDARPIRLVDLKIPDLHLGIQPRTARFRQELVFKRVANFVVNSSGTLAFFIGKIDSRRSFDRPPQKRLDRFFSNDVHGSADSTWQTVLFSLRVS